MSTIDNYEFEITLSNVQPTTEYFWMTMQYGSANDFYVSRQFSPHIDTSTLNLAVSSLHSAANVDTEFYFSLKNIPIVLSPLQDKGVIL